MHTKLQKLADLHRHPYGSIHWKEVLRSVIDHAADWSYHESVFQEVCGEAPGIGPVWRIIRYKVALLIPCISQTSSAFNGIAALVTMLSL